MAGYVIDATDIEKSVVEPTVIQVLDKIREYMSLGTDCNFVYAGDTLAVPQSGSNLSDTHDDPILASSNRLYVELTQTPMSSQIRSTVVTRRGNPPILEDENIGWFVKPVYGDMEFNLELEYRSSDREQVNRWKNAFYTRLCMRNNCIPMEVQHSYPVPEKILRFINEFHTARESRYGYGDDLLEYLDSCLKVKSHYGLSLNKLWKALMIDTQSREMIINIPSSEVPDVERVNDGLGASTYLTRFTVQFYFSKPISFFIKYPIWIHNGFISDKYYDTKLNRNEELEYSLSTSPNLAKTFLEFDRERFSTYKVKYGWVLPKYDDYYIDLKKYGLSANLIWQCLVSYDKTNPKHVVNLKDLEKAGLVINPRIFSYIDRVGSRVFQSPAIIQFVLTNNGNMVNRRTMSIDSDYNIYSGEELDPRGYYHLCMIVNNDIAMLDDSELSDLLIDGDLAIDIVDSIDNDLIDVNFPNKQPDGSIILDDWKDWIGMVCKPSWKNANKSSTMYTVNTLTMISNRS